MCTQAQCQALVSGVQKCSLALKTCTAERRKLAAEKLVDNREKVAEAERRGIKKGILGAVLVQVGAAILVGVIIWGARR